MKKPTFTKSLIALLLFFSPIYLLSQSLVGTAASVPTDNLTQAGPTPGIITPPGGMVAGDLVVIFGQYRANATTISINANGGQTWNTLAQNSGSTQSTYVFWCTYNGTWTGGGPSIRVAAGNTNALTGVMYVFHASHPNNTWSIHVAQAINGTAAGTSHNITGVTTTVPHTVTMAFWASAFQNTWSPTGGTLPAGWSKTNISNQYRNTLAGGQQSNTAAYNIQTTTSGATGNISQDEGGTGTASRTTIVSWNESPVNDACIDAVTLPANGGCSPTSGTLYSATVQGTAGSCGAVKDVWYKFVVPSNLPAGNVVNVAVSLTNTAAVPANNLTPATVSMELFSAIGNTTTCTGTTSVAGGCQNISATRSFANLTPNGTYYIRLTTSVAVPNNNATFDICVTAPAGSRMNEVFKQAIVDNGTMNTPWEVTYGPDGFLWVTASKDYKVYRIDPNSPYTKTQILDLSFAGSDPMKVKFDNVTQSPWPQGGLAGLAIDPQFNSNHYVYISYVLKFDSVSAANAGCGFFKNSLVRFTYNAGTLGSPMVICDTLPGGNDHNSQRLIIAPVNGTNYLFDPQGDMGAGQLACRLRPNHAQDTTYYEGKILRFNLVPDPSEGAYDQWIPNDIPYNKPAKQSAVWAIGIRNNQGFAYNPSTGRLYGSSHGPYSDDEINIIERYKNYGHPLVEGYSADGNYNGNSTPGTSTSYTAGETFATASGVSTIAPIGDEQHNADSINASPFAKYKDPLFSGYAAGGPGYPAAIKTVAAIWSAAPKPGNGGWPSEAWSGLDIYTNSMIPGWKNSLMVCGLKWGRVLRLKLNDGGDTVVQTNGADTVAYWQSLSRYRDIAFGPNGRDVFVSIDGSGNASGPAGVALPATAAKCNNCVIKYTFLGYQNGSGNRSTIPTSLDIGSGIPFNFQTANKVVINAANNNTNLWVPITDTNSNVIAEINARGYNLDTVTTTLFTRTGVSRSSNGLKYVNRNLTITPKTQPLDSVWVRLYISKSEFDQFVTDGGVGSIGQLKIIKNEDSAKKKINQPTILVNTTISEAFNGNSYVLQGTIGEFSSFYFSNSAIITLPLNLLTFRGSLQNSTTLLEWETANEANTSKFIVERSTDGRNFQQIGTVLAAGNSSVNNKYSFTDYDVTRQSSSTVYYRLKMIDMDESFTYSDIVTITLPLTTSRVALYPNPAAHEVNVTITTAVDGKVKWQLIDNAGRIVAHNSLAAKRGNNNVVINLNRLSSGTYFLVVSGADIDQKIKLEKM